MEAEAAGSVPAAARRAVPRSKRSHARSRRSLRSCVRCLKWGATRRVLAVRVRNTSIVTALCSKRAVERRAANGERLTLELPPQSIHVVAGVVIDGHGRVLIAQRPAGKHLAGSWEFPGGKLEPGEARASGLARELREEIGIEIRQPRPLIRLRHRYSYGEVLLDVWVVRRYSGGPRSLDGQQLRWLRRGDLASADLLPADRPIAAALRLPERLRRISTACYRVADSAALMHRTQESGPGNGRAPLRGVFCGNCAEGAAAATAGADFLVMREVLADGDLEALCERVAVPIYARGIALERAWELGASGTNAVV
jgi:mutator protein MutT